MSPSDPGTKSHPHRASAGPDCCSAGVSGPAMQHGGGSKLLTRTENSKDELPLMYNGQHERETITRCYGLERRPPIARLGIEPGGLEPSGNCGGSWGYARCRQPMAHTRETRGSLCSVQTQVSWSKAPVEFGATGTLARAAVTGGRSTWVSRGHLDSRSSGGGHLA